MRYLYSLLITLSLPFALLRLLWCSRKNSDYRKRLDERLMLGQFRTPILTASLTRKEIQKSNELTPQTNKKAKENTPSLLSYKERSDLIWVHSVSVGEFLATLPLIEKLLAEDKEILITTTTPTGSAMVREKLSNRVAHQYLPFDVPFLVNRFLNITQPRIAVFVETEIWANYLHELKKRNIPALLINARLSERSFEGYRKLGTFGREAIASFHKIACQNNASYQRFKQLGANASVVGNLKFDLQRPDNFLEKQTLLQQQLSNRHFILVASTHKGEEELLLSAYHNSEEKRLLVIAPRHPERGDSIATTAEKLGFSTARYTQIDTLSQNTDLLIVDTLGQLLAFYALADYAIIGGSFVNHGGHNPLEAALFATPCIIGKHYFNFDSLIKEMQRKQAIEIRGIDNVFNQQPHQEIGKNAQRFLEQNQGSTETYKQLILCSLMNAN